MTNYIGYRDGGKTNEQGLKEELKRLLTAGVPLSDTATSLQASQRGAGANMSVDVAIGDCHIIRPDATYSYWGFTDAIANVSVSASNPSNPRIDTLVAYVDLSVVSSSSNNNPAALKFQVVAGTPAGSPVALTPSQIQTALGATVPFIQLAQLAVAANATTIVNANITDVRANIAYKGRLYGGATNTLGHVIPNVADDTVALLNATQTLGGHHILGSGTPVEDPWTTWTPTCATLTLGNGTLTGKYTQIGKTVFYDMSLLFGTTTSITASVFTFTFPATPIARTTAQTVAFPFGDVLMYDSSATTYYFGLLVAASATTGEILLPRADSTTFLGTSNAATSGNPFTWAVGDYMYLKGYFEAA